MDRGKEHAFSVELKSRQHLRTIRLGNGGQEQVLIEGSLGELSSLKLVEKSMLEVIGRNGILRLDVTEQELTKRLTERIA